MYNFLDNNQPAFYPVITEIPSGCTAPKDNAAFFIPYLRGMRGANILNNARVLGNSVESPTYSVLGGFTERPRTMTESTLQSLYRYYSEMAKTWYKGDYTIDQETIYGDVFNALENALIRLPMQCPEDRKIKLALLQDIIKSPLLDNNNQIHPENDPGAMLALALCEQLAGEA